MRKLVSAREALENPQWLGSIIGADSFRPMRTILIGSLGEPFSPSDTANSLAAVLKPLQRPYADLYNILEVLMIDAANSRILARRNKRNAQ